MSKEREGENHLLLHVCAILRVLLEVTSQRARFFFLLM